MLRGINVLLILLTFCFRTSLAYTLRLQTKSLVGGDSFVYDVIVDNGDVDVVDLLLVSTQRGNSTVMLENHTMKTGNSQSFTIPRVPAGTYMIRLVQASNKQFILDSTSFQVTSITVISSANSSPSSSTSGSAIPTDDTTAGKTSQGKKKSRTNAGAIAGGVVGGLVALGAAVLALLCCRRKSRRGNQIQDLEKEKLGSSVLDPGTGAGMIDPFTTPHRPSLPSMDGQSAPSSVAGTLPSKLAREYSAPAPTSITGMPSSTSSAVPTSDTSSIHTPALSRAEHLRSKRKRISREIALLEQASGASTYPSSGSVLNSSGMSSIRPGDSASATSSSPRDREISVQLATLQEQIRQIEARQAPSAEPDFSVPPPMYDGPPGPTSASFRAPTLIPVPVSMPVPRTQEESEANRVERVEFPNPVTHPVDAKTPIF